MKPVKTSRVILRQFREGDEEQIYQYASVEGVGERAGWKHHANVQESQSVLYNVFLKNPNCFAITDRESGKIIGSFELSSSSLSNDFPECEHTYEIGYVLAKDYWNQGIMTELMNEVIQELIKEGETDLLFIRANQENKASIKVIEKSGFFCYKIMQDIYNARIDRKETHLCFYLRLKR